ncbi:[Citrate [pro-3S]-lyase] ligase [Synergistales bacterium]|nr:[Citrate [pro-3S]-lyase] ligase [Synergistales bacterium]
MYVSEIRLDSRLDAEDFERLLRGEGIERDRYLDYAVGLRDDDDRLVAAGGCFANTLRCLAVDSAHRGEGLLNRVLSLLSGYEAEWGYYHLFLYTKCGSARFFNDAGFYEIARVPNFLSFMENRRDGFENFLRKLSDETPENKRRGTIAAIVLNANPFTLGHRHLAETASANNDVVHIFVVSEDASLFSFKDRYELVKAGCADLKNIVFHGTDSYMVSRAVFPSYFLGGGDTMSAEAQARLDLALFARIANNLGITRRYVGEEPFSKVTALYNSVMQKELKNAGVECAVEPRKEHRAQPISASGVRRLLKESRWDEVRSLVPAATFEYLSNLPIGYFDSGAQLSK